MLLVTLLFFLSNFLCTNLIHFLVPFLIFLTEIPNCKIHAGLNRRWSVVTIIVLFSSGLFYLIPLLLASLTILESWNDYVLLWIIYECPYTLGFEVYIKSGDSFIYLYRFDDTYRLDYKTLSSQVWSFSLFKPVQIAMALQNNVDNSQAILFQIRQGSIRRGSWSSSEKSLFLIF